MRILLSNSPLDFLSTSPIMFPRVPSLNLLSLAAAGGDGHQWHLVNNNSCRLRAHKLWGELARFRPEMVGISFHTVSASPAIMKFAAEVRKRYHGIVLVTGGAYASYYPGEVLKGGFDIVVRGEGERTFGELCQAFGEGGGGLDALKGIQGLAYRDGRGRVIVNPDRPVIADLDTLPMPDWNLDGTWHRLFTRRRFAMMETSRGCPHRCTFCSIHGYWEDKFRQKSVGRVLAEMDALKAEGVGELLFVDNSFGIDTKFTRALVDAMLERRYNFKWSCLIRPDTVAQNPDLVADMVRAGFFFAIIGFESHDQRTLDMLGKRTTVEQNREAARILRDNRVVSFATHILGLPWENTEDMERNYRVGGRISGIYRIGLFTPLVGSTLHDELQHTGEVWRKDWEDLNYVLHHTHDEAVSKAIERKFLEVALRYYFNPRRMARALMGGTFVRRRIFRMTYKNIALSAFYLALRKLNLRIL